MNSQFNIKIMCAGFDMKNQVYVEKVLLTDCHTRDLATASCDYIKSLAAAAKTCYNSQNPSNRSPSSTGEGVRGVASQDSKEEKLQRLAAGIGQRESR